MQQSTKTTKHSFRNKAYVKHTIYFVTTAVFVTTASNIVFALSLTDISNYKLCLNILRSYFIPNNGAVKTTRTRSADKDFFTIHC